MSLAQDFAGRTALVTGATRGIGLGITQELVDRGAQVVVTARKQDELDAAVAQLDPDGTGRALAVRGSADDEAHQADAVAQAVARYGRLDVLVPNAAVNPQYGPLVDADLAAVRKVLEVNVTAVLGWVQQAWRQSMQQSGGSVLVVASVGGLRSGSPIGAYNASKAAVIHLVRQLGAELGPTVRVNAIAPAVVKTRFAEKLYEGREEEVAAAYPMGRLGLPEDTAKAACFLLSDDAGWITGETLVVDGGVTVAR
ncbi:MAG: family oxidoreductase [Frankiales bacterium]|nr:family oxidoreductase [Frankiales bacterium]